MSGEDQLLVPATFYTSRYLCNCDPDPATVLWGKVMPPRPGHVPVSTRLSRVWSTSSSSSTRTTPPVLKVVSGVDRNADDPTLTSWAFSSRSTTSSLYMASSARCLNALIGVPAPSYFAEWYEDDEPPSHPAYDGVQVSHDGTSTSTLAGPPRALFLTLHRFFVSSEAGNPFQGPPQH